MNNYCNSYLSRVIIRGSLDEFVNAFVDTKFEPSKIRFMEMTEF